MPTAAAADAPASVLVIRTHGDAAISGRMIAELAALGFDVSELAEPAPDKPLVELAQSAGTVAAVRAVPSAHRVELWVVDPNTHGTAFEETVSIDEQRRPDLLAVRAVEVLRARLVKVGLAEQPRGPPPAPPPPEPVAPLPPVERPAPQAPREPLLWLGIGPAVQISAGGIGPIPSAILDVRALPSSKLALVGFVTLPVSSARVQSMEGAANLEPALAGVGAELRTSGAHWMLALGAGIGAVWVDMRGDHATANYVARTDRVTAAAGFADMALCRHMLDALGLCADLRLGSSLPRVAVRFGDRDIATWGRPFATGSLELEVAVPGLSR